MRKPAAGCVRGPPPGCSDPGGSLPGLDYERTLFKRYELEDTALTRKAKQLIGVAIHSDTECRYCTLFPTEVARLFGATEEEIQEIGEYLRSQPRIPAARVAAGV